MRCDERRGVAGVLVGLLLGVVQFGLATVASAMIETDRYDMQASVTTQQTFQHRELSSIEWVQERNEVRLELRYRPILATQPFLIFKSMQLSMLYRGRNDEIFDIRSRYNSVVPGTPSPQLRLGYDRNDFRFPEGEWPREFFLDVSFVHPLQNLSLRIGRQQVVWGEADLFRSLDVVNPLRLDQQGIIGDDLDNYREPLYIAKALYNLGSIDKIKLIDSNIEAFYSPNWRPLTDRIVVGEAFRLGVDRNNILNGFSRNVGQPFRTVRYPWEVSRVGDSYTEAPSQADLGAAPGCGDGLGCADFVYLIRNGVPKQVLDWRDASMFGIRLLGKTVAGLDFTLNYIFKRTEVPGTSLDIADLFDKTRPAPPGSTDPTTANFRSDKLTEAATAHATPAGPSGLPSGDEALIRRCIDGKEPVIILQGLHGPHGNAPKGHVNSSTGCELVNFWYPYTHIIGGTLTYNDYDHTGFIWRLEQSFSSKEPRNGLPPLAGPRAGQYPTKRDFDTHIKRQTQVWRSMIGFDYLRAFPTWAPPFAKRYKYLRTWFYDQWFLTFQFLNEYYAHADNQIGLLDSITDRMQHWNPVFTFVATGFFLNDKFRPWIAAGYDVNAQFPILWLQGTYYITPKLVVRAGDIEYMGSKNAESFLFLHKYADRDTLFVRFTYFFL